MIYLIHGEDEFLRTQALAELRAALGPDETTQSLNLTRLSGAGLTLDALRAAADTMPFLAERRLVIVDRASRSLEPRRAASASAATGAEAGREPGRRAREFATALTDYLRQVPETTDLAFVETEVRTSGPLIGAVRDAGGRVVTANAPRPDSRELVEWIAGRARHHGGRLADERVAHELSRHLGNDLRTLDNELEKLVPYADGRPITVEDVDLLVPQVREAVVFDLVDAVGTGDTRTALRLLRRLVDEQRESPLYVLAMIVRQVRLLLQVKELSAAGMDQRSIAAELKLHPFVAQKLGQQVRNFTLPQLKAAFLRLASLDAGVKHGDLASAEAAIDAFVVELARR